MSEEEQAEYNEWISEREKEMEFYGDSPREDYNEVEDSSSYRERCLYYSPMDLLALEED